MIVRLDLFRIRNIIAARIHPLCSRINHDPPPFSISVEMRRKTFCEEALYLHRFTQGPGRRRDDPRPQSRWPAARYTTEHCLLCQLDARKGLYSPCLSVRRRLCVCPCHTAQKSHLFTFLQDSAHKTASVVFHNTAWIFDVSALLFTAENNFVGGNIRMG